MRKFCLLSTAVLMSMYGVLNAQDFSNRGKEFWLAYSFHVGMVNGGGTPVMTLYITSDVSTPYKVEAYGGATIANGTINAGQVVTVEIPTTYFISNEGLFNGRAIRVTADKPVVVYSYITRSAASGATLCLPTTVLGRQYVSMNYTQISNEGNSHSFITIVAVEDNTAVEITPTADTKNGWAANTTYTVNLNKGDIYQVLGKVNGGTGVDLTGTTVKSVATASGACKKIAVFSGSGKISIGCGATAGSSDNLYQQLYPIATWGKKYLTAPSYGRPNAIYRVAKSTAAANVTVNGAVVPAGSFINNVYEFSTPTPSRIESDEPICVAQYFSTQGCFNNTSPYDPDMIILNPVEQNISNVTLVSSNLVAAQNRQHHLQVILKNAGTALSSFKLDGAPVPVGNWQQHTTDPAYSYIYLSNVAQGYHTLSCDSGFNALAYGYADAETYGYSAGSNIKDLYQYVSINNKYAVVNFPAACKNAPFTFSMTFPYQPTQITWQFNGLFKDTTVANPVFDETVIVNGRTLYKYTLNQDYTTTASGTYPIRIVALNPTSDGCSGLQEIDYDLQVFDPPVVDFNFATDGCTSSPVTFTENITSTNNRAVIHRYWDFGDGTTTIDVTNATHNYNAGGTYNAKYMLITDVGCRADTVLHPVVMSEPPIANFTVNGPYCIGKTVTFTQAATAPTGANVAKWIWNFGDGSPEQTLLTAVNPTHEYQTTGTFTVSLRVHSDKGCISTLFTRNITVNQTPEAKFIAPDICVSDLVAPFNDQSTITAGTVSGWQWDFGDGNALVGNPNTSLVQNATHHYTLPGTYTAQLIAISNAGCTDTVEHLVTVNGAVLTPNFVLQNTTGTAICSNKEVVIKDASRVDAGNIIRVEIFWDDADLTNKTVDAAPTAGKIYSHTYPEFGTPAGRTLTIRYDVYSGITCVNTTRQTITLLATPQLAFDAFLPICSNAAPVQLGAIIQNGMTGSGVFTGKGVSSSGIFNPQIAGEGVHNLLYTFTATNGCVTTATKTVSVDPTPIANAGPNKVVLEGGFVKLTPALITAYPVTYAWTPATWLNNPNIAEPQSSPTEDITYKLTVTSDRGCNTNDTMTVTVLRVPIIPNIFSPNGDGIHDKWEIKYLDTYPGSIIEIFNRYGQRVYRIDNYSKAWDGKINGRDAPVGTYYYVIDPKNGRKPIAGYVDIIR